MSRALQRTSTGASNLIRSSQGYVAARNAEVKSEAEGTCTKSQEKGPCTQTTAPVYLAQPLARINSIPIPANLHQHHLSHRPTHTQAQNPTNASRLWLRPPRVSATMQLPMWIFPRMAGLTGGLVLKV